MPDYAVNELRVHGDPQLVASLVEAVAGDGPFDFSRVYPIPRKVDLVQKDPRAISAEWEWRWEHWGTSRNASDAECLITDGGTTANFPFASAWNPPVAFIDGLAAQYPGLAFKLAFFYDNSVGFGLWMNGSPIGSLMEVPTVEARRLLDNTAIQAQYDSWIKDDDDGEDMDADARRAGGSAMARAGTGAGPA